MTRSAHWRERVRFFKHNPPTGKQPVIFCGDSITEQFDLDKWFTFRPLVNHGIGGDHIDGMSERLHLCFARKPRALFFMIGINDIFDDCDFARLEKKYNALFTRLGALNMARIPLFCFSLLPVGREWNSNEKKNRIKRTNIRLQQRCASLNISFLDLFPHFVQKTGHLNPAFTSDGIHLNEAGYEHWHLTLEQMNRALLRPAAKQVVAGLL